MWLVIFPEGTRYKFKPEQIKQSQEFAESRGMHALINYPYYVLRQLTQQFERRETIEHFHCLQKRFERKLSVNDPTKSS